MTFGLGDVWIGTCESQCRRRRRGGSLLSGFKIAFCISHPWIGEVRKVDNKGVTDKQVCCDFAAKEIIVMYIH